ncbi:hypothetical protein EZS27_043071, partial [termite gut metagenome]
CSIKFSIESSGKYHVFRFANYSCAANEQCFVREQAIDTTILFLHLSSGIFPQIVALLTLFVLKNAYILYNPSSIAIVLREVLSDKIYTAADLLYYQGAYHSFMHHGSFSSPVVSDCLTNINIRLQQIRKKIEYVDHLLITFGTAWIYTYKETGKVVANCHKLPDSKFERRRLNLDEIVTEYTLLLTELLAQN